MNNLRIHVDSVDNQITLVSKALDNEWNDSVNESFRGFIDDLNRTKAQLEESTTKIDNFMDEINNINIDKIQSDVEKVCGDSNG